MLARSRHLSHGGLYRSGPALAAQSPFGGVRSYNSNPNDEADFNRPDMTTTSRIQEFLDYTNRNKITKSDVTNELNTLLHVANRQETEYSLMKSKLKAIEVSLEANGSRDKFANLFKLAGWMVIGYLLYRFSKNGISGSLGESDMFKDNFQEYHPKSSQLHAQTQPSKEQDAEDKLSVVWNKVNKQPQTQTVVDFDVVTFEDVKGNEDAKEELSDLVDYLRNPEKYEEMGLKIPKGVLLAGPPGTGKTLLARALAGEAEVPFINVNGSSFVQMFAGLGAQRVRRLFARARELSPCIIFIDEVDALGVRRDSPQNHTRQTLNQLLGEMDGFQNSTGVIVVGATNLAHTLDAALTRPGRFDRTVQITLPDKKIRLEMLQHYLKDKGTGDVKLDTLASATTGFTGADLFQLVNRAGIEAVKKGKKKISHADLIESQETIIMGRANKDKRMSKLTKEMVAYHEAGHALVSLYTDGANPIYKATVLPRGGALGFVAHTPKDEFLKSKHAMLADIDVCMGGRAAEELMFGIDKVTQGASNDFQQATRTATNMVARYGMSNEIGKVYHSAEDLEKLSPGELEKINGEVKKLLDESYSRAMKVLTDNTKQHKQLAEALLKEETLTVAQIKECIGFKEPILKS